MIKVLVVDDSEILRDYLVYILNSDPEVTVVATASNGEEAIKAVTKFKPDVVTMDIHMPRMNGIDATREIMMTHPLPIIVVSSSGSEEERWTAFAAIEAGAVTVLEKPGLDHDPEKFIRSVKKMAEIKVVRRWSNDKTKAINNRKTPINKEIALSQVELVAIGASTGGPPVLQYLFKNLPDTFPPILVVQHIVSGFLPGLVDWLSQTTEKTVRIANNNDVLMPNQIYIAPDNFHMGINKANRIVLAARDDEYGLRPSVGFLFRSLAECYPKKTLGILLTGMGRDGSVELKLLKDRGAITIAQDKESSIVFGMPGEAVALGAATYILSPVDISQVLNSASKSI